MNRVKAGPMGLLVVSGLLWGFGVPQGLAPLAADEGLGLQPGPAAWPRTAPERPAWIVAPPPPVTAPVTPVEPPVVEIEGEHLAAEVVRPMRQGSGFERLRRGLPYGVSQDPVIRYLTDDEAALYH